MSTGPTYIGGVNGVAFYEHPEMGDEAPLIIHHGGEWWLTCYWDMPAPEEFDHEHEIITTPMNRVGG